jgi:fimbrial chaperone protein
MRALRILAAALALCVASVGAGAFTMEPMSVLLAPSGAGSIATFRIKNDGNSRVAIRLSLLTRSVSMDGKEENGPAGNLLAVYPSRLLIEAGATAAAKVQWRGTKNPESELAFRLVAEEVAIDSGPAKSSGIRVMFRYVASIYVGEEGFAPEMASSAEGSLGSSGEPGFLVELRNRGRRHVVVLDAKLVLRPTDSQPGDSQPGDRAVISSEELGELSGANYLPGTGRKIFIPREAAQIGKRYDVQLDYESDF